ncbi:bifunctional biotin--[acetyl-CoA-carboxylase] ligase/biotin operon repressor BirA [Pseudomonas sp. PDM14]|uniref:bifunctional biotin--[acetyl-CoA-carboxylase] ligase/biotin operon repressor BirA n=1 Tax=Pseudomonas sp. PDM14 TaxID=2769288 RepID=UPI0017811CAD|nr:bifunctional biotin--[acetyl-CoA-carboxylase] ligase/biotin operon repressor BirA [Pseudomonas sp. PDM14]MBD9485193.1 bifunctional biotin--[acetyl-CoA-carboxylase] ligase/biotin operon repressor BirA [Pseudomonas sp. PDM14]
MQKVLQMLQDGEFHSGEALGSVLGVSRAAVWKRLQHIEREFGVPIFRVPGRGYRLESPLSLLNSDAIKAGLESQGWTSSVLDSVDSTNAEAMRQIASQPEVLPLVVLAEVQSAGRGRRGRTWVSPYGENLYYSLGLSIDGGDFPLVGLSLSVGLAVHAVLRDLGCADVGLKWPNDVLAGGRKIAGILIEIAGDPAGSCQVVIGIGINVNMRSGEAEIDQPWTSLRNDRGVLIDRSALVLSLSRQLARYLDLHCCEGFAALQGEWESVHLWQGAAVTLVSGLQRIEGRVLGIDKQGALRLDVMGEERQFSGGELSLRLRNDS